MSSLVQPRHAVIVQAQRKAVQAAGGDGRDADLLSSMPSREPRFSIADVMDHRAHRHAQMHANMGPQPVRALDCTGLMGSAVQATCTENGAEGCSTPQVCLSWQL